MPNFEHIPPDIVQIIKAHIQQYLDDPEKAISPAKNHRAKSCLPQISGPRGTPDSGHPVRTAPWLMPVFLT
jgi:hypothetical protein